ncbi:hypothetical protein ACIQXD_22785 [Streptomyces uncialis]|uniref:hypothetical protein n=1 Tax=Streptomyces uncialis TaxID=1048205 RepID=UPI003827E27B
MSALTFYNAFYMQGARGYSPMEAGLAGLPTALGAILGAPLGAYLVRRWSLRLVTVPALTVPARTVAALTMGAYGLFGLRTPLGWIELLLLVQGLSIGMMPGPGAEASAGHELDRGPGHEPGHEQDGGPARGGANARTGADVRPAPDPVPQAPDPLPHAPGPD